uniref:Matrin-type domain-containing protein n=1 Tax=Mesocestoides corti TaxID=53468 RepID=A0A5K3F8L6_MESCO
MPVILSPRDKKGAWKDNWMTDTAAPQSEPNLCNYGEVKMRAEADIRSPSTLPDLLLEDEAKENFAVTDNINPLGSSFRPVSYMQEMNFLRRHSVEIRTSQKRDPKNRTSVFANWPHLKTRGWYHCKLCEVYDCQRKEFQRHLLGENHKSHRRK